MAASTVVGKEVIEVTKELGNLVGTALSTMADKLSVPVEHVYKIMVTQYVIEGYLGLILLSLGTIIFFVIGMWVFKKAKEAGMGDHQGAIMLRVAGGFSWGFGGLTLIALFCAAPYFITCIVNPEYHILKDMLNLVGNIR